MSFTYTKKPIEWAMTGLGELGMHFNLRRDFPNFSNILYGKSTGGESAIGIDVRNDYKLTDKLSIILVNRKNPSEKCIFDTDASDLSCNPPPPFDIRENTLVPEEIVEMLACLIADAVTFGRKISFDSFKELQDHEEFVRKSILVNSYNTKEEEKEKTVLQTCDSCLTSGDIKDMYQCIPDFITCSKCHGKFIYDTSAKMIINRFNNLKYNKDTKTFEPFDFYKSYGFESLNLSEDDDRFLDVLVDEKRYTTKDYACCPEIGRDMPCMTVCNIGDECNEAHAYTIPFEDRQKFGKTQIENWIKEANESEEDEYYDDYGDWD